MKPPPQAIENAARADAEFDGRGWLQMPKCERERYLARSAFTLSHDLGDMVVVPKEPTEAMLEAAVVAGHQANKPFVERIKSRSFEAGMSSDITAGDGRIYRAAYRAMIAAAEGE